MNAKVTPMSTNPIEHDTRLLDLFREAAKADQMLGWKLSTLRHATRPREIRWERDDKRSIKEIVAAAEALIAEGDVRMLQQMGTPSHFLHEYRVALSDLREAEGRIVENERAYAGWQRFFLVTSSSGLVHSSMHCHTCNKGRKQTTFALIPSFSGRAVDGLVELVGPALCSVCFPAAPVEWTDAVRIPGRIAEYLLSLGEDEFRAELATYKTKQAAKAAKKGS